MNFYQIQKQPSSNSISTDTVTTTATNSSSTNYTMKTSPTSDADGSITIPSSSIILSNTPRKSTGIPISKIANDTATSILRADMVDCNVNGDDDDDICLSSGHHLISSSVPSYSNAGTSYQQQNMLLPQLSSSVSSSVATSISSSLNLQFQTDYPIKSPFSASDMGIPSKKYIVYLEPDRNSPFYQSILQFFDSSKQLFGINEAHMYHPHTSLTGFFDMPLTDNVDLDQLLIDRLDSCFSQFIVPSQFSPAAMKRPQISKSSSCKKDALSIPVSVPESYRHSIGYFKKTVESELKRLQKTSGELLPCFQIRLKPMDHISLAYLKTMPDLQGVNRLTEQTLAELKLLAQNIICFEEPVDWYMVLYNVELRSKDIAVPHKFQLLKKWKVSPASPSSLSSSIDTSDFSN